MALLWEVKIWYYINLNKALLFRAIQLACRKPKVKVREAKWFSEAKLLSERRERTLLVVRLFHFQLFLVCQHILA